MENPIKIEVNVNLNMSEDMKSFVANLFGAQASAVPAKPTPAAPAPQAPAPQAPAPQAPAPQAPAPKKPAAPKPAPAPAPAPQAPAPAQEAAKEVTLEDLRDLLNQKRDTCREQIKAKLNELGSNNLTNLDPSKYQEMYDFFISL